MGKQCYNPKLFYAQTGTLEPCPEKYYFSESGQRNVYSKYVLHLPASNS